MKHKLSPESEMMSFGYDPNLSEGAIKPPIFQTSTFVFKCAQDGKSFFEISTGKREKKTNEHIGLIYSRMNNPNMEILENRLTLWDGAEDCAVFESGMAAISTMLLAMLKPGDLFLFSTPVYGGTDHFIHDFLHKIGIHTAYFKPGQSAADIEKIIKNSGHADKLSMIYVETPANPTNTLIDIGDCKKVADKFSTTDKQVLVAVDNTYMGPLWSHPIKHGADLVLYSATKYIGGHSDVIAGACLGSKKLVAKVKSLRSYLGGMAGPWTGWLLMRSLETLKVRMEQQARNAEQVAHYLAKHPKVEKVYYLGLIPKGTKEFEIYQKQYSSPGAMIS